MENGEPSRIAALVQLLGDESPRVFGPVRQELERVGEAAFPWLREAAVHAEDARLRIRARRILADIRRREVLEDWSELERLDLETGAILISRLAYPNESGDVVRAQLDEYAGVLRRRLSTARTIEGAVDQLVSLLAGELGFCGGDVDYEDPDNSFIHRVLENKRGLPILLSAVYLCVARRVDLPICGVGMPHHFVLKYSSHGHDVFVDPFGDGKLLSTADCRHFLDKAGISFHPSYFDASSDQEIISRILGNLLRSYQARGDSVRLSKILALVRLIERSGDSEKTLS